MEAGDTESHSRAIIWGEEGLGIDLDWPYVAGYFDGEGSVGLYRQGGHFACSLIWCNTHLASLQAIEQFIGCGRITERKRRKQEAHWKQCYVLRVSRRRQMLPVAQAMLPYCLIKADALAQLVSVLVSMRDGRQGALVEVAPEKIRRLYWDEALSQSEIARRLCVGQNAVKAYMQKHGIPARSYKEAAALTVYDPVTEAARRVKIRAANLVAWADPVQRGRRVRGMRQYQDKLKASLEAARKPK